MSIIMYLDINAVSYLYYFFHYGLKTINEIFWEFYGKTFKLPIEAKFDFLKIIKDFGKDFQLLYFINLDCYFSVW